MLPFEQNAPFFFEQYFEYKYLMLAYTESRVSKNMQTLV